MDPTRIIGGDGESLRRRSAALIALACLAVLGAALAFQHLGGLAPCELCIYQRYGYLAALAPAAAALALTGRAGAALVALSGLALLATAAIGGYHAGVEYGWWAGPDACSGVAGLDATSVEDLRAALLSAPVVRCDEIQWSLFGVTMAGYNVFIAGGLGALSLAAAAMIGRRG